MITFRSLASSSLGCCYHLSCPGNDPLLIEAGISFKQIRQALNFKTSQLAGCLISHAHGDHCKGVTELAKSGTEIYASSQTLYQFNKAPNHRLNVIQHEKPVQIGMWMVTPFDVVHDLVGTLGFVIDSPLGDRLLFLTDSMYAPHPIPGMTHIAIECNFDPEILKENTARGSIDPSRYARTHMTHMSLPTCLAFLEANDLSKVQEIHLLHLSSANSDAIEFQKAVHRKTGIPCKIAEEFSI